MAEESRATTDPDVPSTRWRWVIAIASAAVIFGLLASFQGYYQAVLRGGEGDLWRALRVWMPDYLLWALSVPLVLRLGRRWPLTSDRWAGNLLRHVGVGVLLTLVELQLSVQIVGRIVGGLPPAGYGGYWEWYQSVVTFSTGRGACSSTS